MLLELPRASVHLLRLEATGRSSGLIHPQSTLNDCSNCLRHLLVDMYLQDSRHDRDHLDQRQLSLESLELCALADRTEWHSHPRVAGMGIHNVRRSSILRIQPW